MQSPGLTSTRCHILMCVRNLVNSNCKYLLLDFKFETVEQRFCLFKVTTIPFYFCRRVLLLFLWASARTVANHKQESLSSTSTGRILIPTVCNDANDMIMLQDHSFWLGLLLLSNLWQFFQAVRRSMTWEKRQDNQSEQKWRDYELKHPVWKNLRRSLWTSTA